MLKAKYFFIIGCAIIASLGMYPYAKDFSSTLLSNEWAKAVSAVIFVATALTANVALGGFSFLDTLKSIKKLPFLHILLTGWISLIAAVSTGFTCFVGYSNHFP